MKATDASERMTDEARKNAARLTEAQRKLVRASEPGAWGRDTDGTGVEIAGPLYRTAWRLRALGLGDYTHGSPYGDLYFNNERGLAVRRELERKAS